MFCQNCGKEIGASAAFCPHCGQKIQPAVSPAAPANKTEAFIAAKQQQAAAPAQQPGTVPPPVRQPYAPQGQQPPYGAPYAPQPPKKKKSFPAWAIVLIVVGALLITGTVSAVIIGHKIKESIVNYGSEVESEFEDLFNTTGEQEDLTAQNPPGEPDYNNVGRPEVRDFAWFNGIPQDFPQGSTRLTSGEQINGRWKAYYDMGTVKELVNIDLAAGDRAVTVTIDPYMINYDGMEWEYESDAKPYSYEGALDEGSITAHSDTLGTIRLYAFYELDGRQYAFGDTMLQSGETVTIALVRP